MCSNWRRTSGDLGPAKYNQIAFERGNNSLVSLQLHTGAGIRKGLLIVASRRELKETLHLEQRVKVLY